MPRGMRPLRIYETDEALLRVCRYRYATCTLPDGQECTLGAKWQKTQNVADYCTAVERSAGCRHVGENITRGQWEHRRMGKSV